MLEVKCYGGPAHGRTMKLTDHAVPRIEMIPKPHLLPRLSSMPFDMIPPAPIAYETCTYYLQTHRQYGVTEWHSEVYRQLMVLVLDGADLTIREEHDLERDLERVPWIWKHKPSILRWFEAWWEKALHDEGVKKAKVYY